jgi:hypothetical protein
MKTPQWQKGIVIACLFVSVATILFNLSDQYLLDASAFTGHLSKAFSIACLLYALSYLMSIVSLVCTICFAKKNFLSMANTRDNAYCDTDRYTGSLYDRYTPEITEPH